MKHAAFLDQPGFHIVTPRTDMTPADYANPIEQVTRPFDWQDRVVMAGCAAVVVALLVCVFVPA